MLKTKSSHQFLYLYAPISLRLFSDRLEIENPGGLYGRMTLDLLGRISADTRNPFIAIGMEVLAQAENRFSGIPTIRRLMKECELPAPSFETYRGVFKATLYNKKESAPKLIPTGTLRERILDFCQTPRSRKELELAFSDVTIVHLMNKTIKPLIAEGKIELTMPNKPKSKFQKYFTKQL